MAGVINSQPKCASSGQGCPLSREHLWPTSLGVGGGGKDYRDRFELRIELSSVNTARSNKRFEMLLDDNGNCKQQLFPGCKTPGNSNVMNDFSVVVNPVTATSVDATLAEYIYIILKKKRIRCSNRLFLTLHLLLDPLKMEASGLHLPSIGEISLVVFSTWL